MCDAAQRTDDPIGDGDEEDGEEDLAGYGGEDLGEVVGADRVVAILMLSLKDGLLKWEGLQRAAHPS